MGLYPNNQSGRLYQPHAAGPVIHLESGDPWPAGVRRH